MMNIGNSPISMEYAEAIGLGAVVGATLQSPTGTHPGLPGDNIEETIWDQGGEYVFMVDDGGAANLYGSSSSASDVGNVIAVLGLDSDYNEVTGFYVTNGQTQVVITDAPGAGSPISFIAVNSASNGLPGAATLLGDVYIARSGSVTGGVPDTPSEIKAKIIFDVAKGKSKNITRQCVFTVPAGKQYHVWQFQIFVGKNRDIMVLPYVRPFGGVFLEVSQFEHYQEPLIVSLKVPFIVDEKSDIRINAASPNAGTPATFNLTGFLVTK